MRRRLRGDQSVYAKYKAVNLAALEFQGSQTRSLLGEQPMARLYGGVGVGYTLFDVRGMQARLVTARDDLVALPRGVVGEAPGRGRWPSSSQAGAI